MSGNQMQLEDWLDDLCVRFIINLPQEDLSSVARICFQVEEAQWFYEDFIRPLDPTLPSMSLRTFCLRIFQHCPLLASFSVENHTKAFEEFLQYKTRVPVRGAIMLNQAMDSVVLVKGWKKGASWSFPRGKINKDESDIDCAVREVYEETGLDLHAAGLVPTEKKPKYIEISMREQQLRLYVFRDIPMDTDFQPRTRKEISKIQWYKLSELPAFRKKGDKAAQNHNDNVPGSSTNKFYMVAPFLVPLKKWIATQRKADDKRNLGGIHAYPAQHLLTADEIQSTEDDAWATDQPSASGPIPAMNTLDGATQELARLLKMQPPASGLQALPREDKGSALLSILQANHSDVREQAQTPQTRPDFTIAGSPQPRNPHHHHNNQRPFQANNLAQEPPPFFNIADRTKEPSQHAPRQPDVSRPDSQSIMALFHNSSHKNEPIPTPAQAPAQPLQPQGVDVPFSRGTNQGSSGISEAKNQQMNLNGHSIALLSALTRDRSPLPPPQSIVEQPARRSSPVRGPGQFTQQPPTNMSGNALYQQWGNQSSRHVSLPHGPGGFPGRGIINRNDDHRSALLDMFKKAAPELAPAGVSDVGQLGAGSNQEIKGVNVAPSLPFLLHNRLSETRTMSLDQASARARAEQHGVAKRQDWENMTPNKEASQPTLGQPTRILKRGQNPNDSNHMSSPTALLQDHQLQTLGEKPGNAVQQKVLAPAGNAASTCKAPDAQKRQLLSLFSKQQMSAVDTKHETEDTRPRVDAAASGNGAPQSTSSRRGTETPMSPADQSFLLEYLQTVTNSASR